MVGAMLGDGWCNVGRWLVQCWVWLVQCWVMIGTMLGDGWCNVGLLLVQRRLVVGTTLACGLHNVGL